ncbi:hypothetical protein DPMN_190727 [Dreissena polymorpha]|uniref:Uncharacterized protein n=1 Tax=Dreissena polymorpha TaxID=45954 RepID=A0A9D4BCH2_DREPO|nr:hypothetical protein DPMN_190727 [Dreissena polymorpha]
MLHIFKILNQFVSVNIIDIELVQTKNRGHKYKLKKHTIQSNFGAKRFSNRVINEWIELPSKSMESENVNAFKKSLNSSWKDHDNKFYNQ